MARERLDILEREQEIRQWINEHQSMAFMARQLKCKVDTLKRYLSIMGIQYAGNQGGYGHKHSGQYKTAIEYMKGNYVKGRVLREKLIKDGIKTRCCECCGLTTWNGSPIHLEVHHKDGNHYNNTLENIELVCPNCHAWRQYVEHH